MFLKHLLLRPEILSRLIFSVSDGSSFYVQATETQRARRALPEEIVRQTFILSLLHDYQYPEDRIRLEWPVQMGREKKRADIVVLDKDGNAFIIIEVKVEIDQHTIGQLKSYMAITGAKYGAVVSATEMQSIKMLSHSEVVGVKDLPLFLERINLLDENKKEEEVFSLEERASLIENKDNSIKSIDYGVAEKAKKAPPAPPTIEIEGFKRETRTFAVITIKGHSLRLPMAQIDDYKKLRKHFLEDGVALDPRIKQAQWFEQFSQILAESPLVEEISPSKIDPWENRIKDWLKLRLDNLKDDEKSELTLKEILHEVLGTAPRDLTKAHQMRGAACLKKLGYTKVRKFINGHQYMVWEKAA